MRKTYHLYFIAFLSLIQNVEALSAEGDIELAPIQVLGHFNSSSIFESVPTTSSLDGRELLLKSQNSLGETLKDEVGINSTQFGPAASRPVIRGLGGERIRILQNGLGLLDASNSSQDHAVATNPLSADSVEVVRGPINLLYGSSAIGGVVNIVNSRIQKNPISGFLGVLDLKSESVNSGQNYAGKFDFGEKNFAAHIDGNYSKAGNLETPIGTIANSNMEQHSAALGATYFGDKKNYFGASYSKFENIYGLVKEENAKIDLEQDRIELEGFYGLQGFFKGLRLKSAQTFYEHNETEEGEVGTKFENSGNETRVEFIQKETQSWSGIFGIQAQFFEFVAEGDEAFLPTTESRSLAFFGYEEYLEGDWKINIGIRGEFIDLEAESLDNPRTDTAQSSNVYALAMGGLYRFSSNFSTGINFSFNERAPSYQELFAQGVHVAIGIFEQGDPNLNKEKAIGAEWSLRYKEDNNQAILTTFYQNFDDFISLESSGTFNDGLEDFEKFYYLQSEAELRGIEFEWKSKLAWNLESRLAFDYLYGQNSEKNVSLPRISPIRMALNLDYVRDRWRAGVEWRRVLEQDRTAPQETTTDGYDLFNLAGTYRLPIRKESAANIYAKLNNLNNVIARNHVSLLKRQLPLPGRNIVIGTRWLF